jgi:hypothetical protein
VPRRRTIDGAGDFRRKGDRAIHASMRRPGILSAPPPSTMSHVDRPCRRSPGPTSLLRGTGRRLFDGETVSHTLADVLRADIDFNALPRDTPAVVRHMLRRCLDRDAGSRLRDIGEARIALAQAAVVAATTESFERRADPRSLIPDP